MSCSKWSPQQRSENATSYSSGHRLTHREEKHDRSAGCPVRQDSHDVWREARLIIDPLEIGCAADKEAHQPDFCDSRRCGPTRMAGSRCGTGPSSPRKLPLVQSAHRRKLSSLDRLLFFSTSTQLRTHKVTKSPGRVSFPPADGEGCGAVVPERVIGLTIGRVVRVVLGGAVVSESEGNVVVASAIVDSADVGWAVLGPCVCHVPRLGSQTRQRYWSRSTLHSTFQSSLIQSSLRLTGPAAPVAFGRGGKVVRIDS